MNKFILLILILICQDAFATEYYVSTSGNDKNDGKSESKAWRTISHAVSKAVAGDIVWIKAGNYGKENVKFRKDGKKNRPISFIGYRKKKGDINSMYFKYAKGKSLDASKMPLLDGKNRADGVGLKLYERSHIIIKNIQITNYRYGIDALSGANNLTIDNIVVSNAGGTSKYGPVSGGNCIRMDSNINHHNKIINSVVMNATMIAITVGGDYNIIENNKTYADQDDINGDKRSMDYHVIISGSNNVLRNHYAEHIGNLAHTGHGLVLKSLENSTPVENNLIENCDVINVNGSIEFRHRLVKNNIARDIRIKGKSSDYAGGFHFRDGASFNLVENSYVKDLKKGNNGAISFYDTKEDGGTQWSGNDNIIKNTIFENCDLGIRLGTNNTPSNAYNNKILNCTFYNVDNMLGFWPKSKNKNNVIQNCIIAKSEFQFYQNEIQSGWSESYNNYYDNKFSKPKGSGNISVEPGFVNAAKGDFRLKSTSKLIDVGKKVQEVKNDFDGNKRPKGSSHDIGAFEYQGRISSSVKADAGEDQTICKGDKVILTAAGGDKFSWSTGEKTNSISVSPDKTTTYKVKVSTGGNSDEDEVTVTVNDVKAYAGKDVTIKQGEKVTLKASGGDTYLWSSGETTQSITVSPDKSKTYSVTATKDGCEDTDKVTVKVEASSAPVVAEVSEDIVICKGEEVTLKASGGTDYSWSNGKTSSEIKVSPDKTTTYTVTASDGVTKDEAEVTVTVNEVKAYAGKDVTIKQGEIVTLKASGGDTYLWSTGETTQSITVSPEKSKTYGVTATKDGCEDIDKVTVKVEASSAPVVAEVSEDIVICKGEEVTLKASGGTDYSWSNGKTSSEIKVSPDKTTTYTVTASDGVTKDEAEVTVTVNEVKAYAGKDVTIKEGEEVTLKASGGDAYLWSTGETTQSITVSPEKSKTYGVTVTKDGCEDIDKVTVKIEGLPAPVVAKVTEDVIICMGEEVTLKASGGTDYSWSNGKTSSEIKVSPDKTTTYKVTVSDGITNDEAEVTVTVNEVKANAGKDVAIKEGEAVTLKASGGDTYLWSTGETTQSITVNPEKSKTYGVTVTKDGCEDLDKVTVKVEALSSSPVVAEVSEDIAICKGEEVTLTASGGTDYGWSNGKTSSEIKVSPDKTTTYKVTVSDGITNDEAEVTVTVNEVKANAGPDVQIKTGESIKLTASGGDSFKWSNGETSKSIIVSPLLTTEYEVQVERNGCLDFDTVKVVVSSLENSAITASAGKDVTICAGETVTLTASGGSLYKWSNGKTTKSISVNPVTTTRYEVEVSDGIRSGKDEVTVFVETLEANAGDNLTMTEGESVTLTATGGERYEWSNGENTRSITISPKETTIYTVTVFNMNCQDSDSVQITVNKRADLDELPPIAIAGEDINICSGESTTLKAKGTGSFLWSTGDESAIIKVSPKRTTTYLLKASNGGVTVTDTVVVYVENCENELENLADLNLTVYPNPSNGLVTMNISGVENALDLELFDINGRLIHKEKVDGRYQQVNKQVDLSRLPKGMYIVRIYNLNQSVVGKILLV